MAERFGKYRLLYRIAVGGMAEIFVAQQEGMQGFSRKIVIKRIRPNLSSKETFVNMFLNEAKLAAQLNHSNIGQIYDLGRIGSSFFIAMEYVRGRDMRAVVRKAERRNIPFPLEYSLLVAREILEGLYYAHRKKDDNGNPLNVVHRDVTPENVILSFDGEVKLLDFGIAKAENMTSDTRAGEIKGKLGYMSPEQIKGKNLDQRSDIFSFGVVLYEWVTGHRLFGQGEDAEVLRNVVEGKIYPPSYFKDDLPEPVEALIMKSLRRNRQERYQSAWEMQFDINQFMSKLAFNPSNIHLSNFLRQLFSEEISKEEKRLSEAERQAMIEAAGDDEGEREVTASVVVDSTGEAPADDTRVQPRQPSGVEASQASVENDAAGESSDGKKKSEEKLDADPLVAELLAEKEGHLSLQVEIERGQYEMLRVLAERNGLTMPELINQLIEQYTRFL